MKVLPPPDQVQPSDVAQPIYEPTANEAKALDLPPSNGEPATTTPADDDLDGLVANLDAPADPLDALVSQLPQDASHETAWRAAHSEATPEQQAQALQHSEATGIPPSVAAALPKDVARTAKLLQVQRDIEGRPGLQSYMADTKGADLAKDDTSTLGRIEDGLKDYASLWWGDSSIPSQALAFTYDKVLTPIGQVARDEVLGQESHALKFAGAKGLDIPWGRQHIASLDASLEKNAKEEAANLGNSFVGNLYLGTLRMGGMMARYQLAGVLGGWAGAAVSAETGPGAAAGATIGGLAAMGGYGYYEGTGEAWWRLVNLQDPQGHRMNPLLARVFAESAGVLNGVFMAGLGHFGVKLPFAKRFLARFSQDAAEKALVQMTGASIVKKALGTFTKNELVGVGTMAALTAANGAVEETAKATSNLGGETHLEVDPLQPLRDMRDGLGASARDFLIISAFGPAREVFRDVGRLRTSRADLHRMDALVEATDATKLAAISPPEFRKALEKMTSDGQQPAKVYVPVEQLTRLAQEQNLEPEKLAASLAGDGGASYREAIASKDENVALPLAEYLSKAVKSGQHERFKQDIKLDPEGYTEREAKANAKRIEETVKGLLQKYEPGRNEAADAVYQDFFDRAMATGKVPRNEADRNARLTAAVFGNWGRHLKEDPFELYKRNELEIFGPELEHLEPKMKAALEEARGRDPIPLDDEGKSLLSTAPTEETPTDKKRAAFDRLGVDERRRQLFTDPVTGLYNERGFALLPRPEGRPYLARFSFEGGKAINDYHGHESYDGALRAMARTLEAQGVVDAAKRSGDLEAWVSSPEEADRLAAAMSKVLGGKKGTLRVTTGTAKAVEPTADTADARAKAMEATREEMGKAHQATKDALVAKGEHGHRKGLPASASGKLPRIDYDGKAAEAGLKPDSPEAIEKFGLPLDSEEAQKALRKAATRGPLKSLAARFAKQARAKGPELTDAHHAEFISQEQAGSTFQTIHRTEHGALTDEGFRLARAADKKANVVSADARGIRGMNDAFGKEGTDRILAEFERTLVKLGGDAFDIAHPHGDEFFAQAHSEEVAKAFLESVKRHTDRLVFFKDLPADKEKGLPARIAIQEGVHFAYGLGKSFDAADRIALPDAKRKQGSTPGPVVLDVPAGRKRLAGLIAAGHLVRDVEHEGVAAGAGAQGLRPGDLGRGGEGRPEGRGDGSGQAGEVGGPGGENPQRGDVAPEVDRSSERRTAAPTADELARALKHVDRMKDPERRRLALGWIEYARDFDKGAEPPKDGEFSRGVPRDLEMDLLKHGIVNPLGFTPTEALRRAHLERLANARRKRRYVGGQVLRQEGAPAQTETPAFKAWFGESKVVDADGKPLVVYHGTNADFSAFDSEEIGSNYGADSRGFFFTSDPSEGSDYAVHDAAAYKNGAREGANVIPAYVSLQKPLVIDEAFLRSEGMGGVLGRTEDSITFWDNYQSLIHDWIDEKGADGVIVVDPSAKVNGEPRRLVVALKPEQIKSAIGNRGTFDPNEASILKQEDLGSFSLRKEGDRGEIVFTPPTTDGTPRTFRIHLLHNADASTLAHETFHFLNQVMGDLAQLPGSDAIRADYEKMLAWMGYASHDERVTLTAKAHGAGEAAEKAGKAVALREERATHAWEQYLLEGRAPSAELAGTFARFARWLGRIYGSIQTLKDRFLGRYGEEINLTDEVRGIFDRLLATEEATTDYRQREAQAAAPFQAALEGMTEEERAAYLDTLRQEKEATEAETFRRLTEEDKKSQRALVKARREGIRTEAEKAILADEAQRALFYFERGEMPDTPGNVPATLKDEHGKPYKLDREEVLGFAGKDATEALPPYLFAKKGEPTAPADHLAGLLGFTTREDMVAKLRAAEPRRDLVEAETAFRVRREFGPMLLDDVGAVAEAVIEAAHNDKALQRRMVELRALQRLAFPKADPRAKVLDAEMARSLAKVLVARKTVGELLAGRQGAAGHFLRLEREARKKAFAAADKGKTSEAYGHQETAVLNFMLYREALKLRERLKKGQAKLEQANKDSARAKLGLADPSYRDAHDAILHAVGLREEAPASSGPAALDAFVLTAGGNVQEVGFDVDGLKALMADPKPWKQLTVEEAQNVIDASTNIRTAARRVNEVLVLDKTMTKDAFIEDTAARLEGLPEGPKLPRDKARETILQKVGRGAQWLDAILTNTETMVGFLTKGDTTHPLYRLFVEGYVKARNYKADLVRDFLRDLLPKWEQLPQAMRDRMREPVDVSKELPLPEDVRHLVTEDGQVSRSQLLMMALNLGNEGNKERLLGGYGWTEEQVRTVLDRELSTAEWRWVQGVWDSLEKLYPLIAKLEEEETGLRPGKVEATPVHLPDGTVLRGGYFPAKYDPRVPSLGVRQEESAIARFFDPAYKRATTAKSHTKARAEHFEDVVNLDWGVVPSHVAQVLHDLAFRRYVKDAAGILLDKRMQLLLQRYLGREGALQLDPWLKAVANAQADAVPANLATGQRIMASIRNRVAVQVLGHNLPVALGDFSNLLVAGGTWEVRPDHMSKAVARSYLHWNDVRAWALEQSPELRFRADRISRALAHQLEGMGGAKKGGAPEWLREHAFVFMEWSDKLTATPIWLGRFDEAIGAGKSHEEAVALADGAVRKLFPPEDIAEASPLTRDRRGIGGMVMFYGYMNKMFNLQRGWVRELHLRYRDENVSTAGAVAKFGGKMLALSLSAGLIGEWLSGRGEDQGEPWWQWVVRKVLTFPAYTVPFMGPMVEMALGKKASQRLTPGVNFLERTAKTLAELAEDPTQEKALFDALALLGFAKNVPTRGLTQNAKYLGDVATGEERPRGAFDFAGGTLYGKRPKQPDNPLTDTQDVLETQKP